MGGRRRGTPRPGIGGVTWTGGISAARYLFMAGLAVAMYLVAAGVPFTDVPFRPLVLAVALIGGLALGVALAQLHASRPALPGGLATVGRTLSRMAMVVVWGATILLVRNLDAERAEWMMLGLCALSMSAAGYRWRRDGRVMRPA